jgi:hypothetical protein
MRRRLLQFTTVKSAARKSVGEPTAAPAPENDAVWAALMRAPVGPPDTEEERKIIESARARGEWIPGSVSGLKGA